MLVMFLGLCFFQGFPKDPVDARIVTSDITLFWESFDRMDQGGNPFETYLARGSQGVKDFIPERITSAEWLLEMVQKEKDYFEKIRASSFKSRQFVKQIRASFYALEYWYPKATWPPVYFVIGATTSGGTASKNGMIIGMETYADKAVKTSYGRPALDLDLLPFVVTHEMIHFLQKNQPKTLLDAVLLEGSADFLAEMFAGEKVKLCNGPRVYAYGDRHEEKLWQEFKQVMYSEDYGPWLYGQTQAGCPQNLGYWMGYQITQAYFNQARDKRKAVAEIIEMTDSRAFLKASGYEKP